MEIFSLEKEYFKKEISPALELTGINIEDFYLFVNQKCKLDSQIFFPSKKIQAKDFRIRYSLNYY